MEELSASVSPSEPSAPDGVAKGDWFKRVGMDTTALGLVLGLSAVFATMAMTIGVRPEQYVAPAARWFAVAVLAIGLVWSLWLVARPPLVVRAQRRPLHIAAMVLSVVVFLWVPALWAGAYDDRHSSTQLMVNNLSMWIPIALLLVSVGLATASRRRCRQLLAWSVCTILAFILMIYAVLIVGVDPFVS